MSTIGSRKIKDLIDNQTQEPVYIKGHAQATFMSDGATVEDAINNLLVSGIGGDSSGNSEPSSVTATPNTIVKRDGLGQIYANAFIDENSMIWVTPTSSTDAIESADRVFQDRIYDIDEIRSGAAKGATALQSYTEQYKGTITGVSANGTSVATSGVANIPAASTSAYGVTKLSSATNSTSTTLAATPSAVKAAYDLANSYKGTVTGVKINGTTKNPSSGIVDLGTVITAHQTLKTINGQSIIGSGDITIEGGGGDDIRYFTEFTVSDFVLACNDESSITSEGLFDAIMSNKIICIPYSHIDGDKGYIIASANYSYVNFTDNHSFTMTMEQGSILYGASNDTQDLGSNELWGYRAESGVVSIAYLDADSLSGGYKDNMIYFIEGSVNEFVVAGDFIKGSTFRFRTGDNPTFVFFIDILWANGVMPEIEPNTYYELSIVVTVDNYLAACLTPFKPVE